MPEMRSEKTREKMFEEDEDLKKYVAKSERPWYRIGYKKSLRKLRNNLKSANFF